MNIELIIRSILLGAGLAMDAFSVSLADGLSEPELKLPRALTIAGTFAGFQFFMPVAGWFLVRTAAEAFTSFQKFIPWIALFLLLYIGGKMLLEGIRENRSAGAADGATGDAAGEPTCAVGAKRIAAGELFTQGVATSIDALSVGFTIAGYTALTAISSSLIIGVVTLVICIAGLYIGREIGTRLAGKASILGGVILIAIGFEIWAQGVLL